VVARQAGIDPLQYAIIATAAIGVGCLIACGIRRIRASDAIRPMLPYVAVRVPGLQSLS
jgi:hypothetical protein